MSDDFVICSICGKRFKTINALHLATHGLTVGQYKKMFPTDIMRVEFLGVEHSKVVKKQASLRKRDSKGRWASGNIVEKQDIQTISCAACGKRLRWINNIHLNSHGLTADEYRSRYPSSPLMTEEVRALKAERGIKILSTSDPVCRKMARTPEAMKNRRKAARKRRGKPRPPEVGKKVSEALKRKYRTDPVWHKEEFERKSKRMKMLHATGRIAAKYKDTIPEKWFKLLLDLEEIQYSQHAVLPGMPEPYTRHPFDFIIDELRVVVEVDGCYWHGCPVHCPGANQVIAKRDAEMNLIVPTLGWRMVRVWEHDIKAAMKNETDKFLNILSVLAG